MKQCSKCGDWKHEAAFGDGNNKRKDGSRAINSICRQCIAKRMREYRKSNPDKIRVYSRKSYEKSRDKWTDKNLKKNYGISLSDYEYLYESQNGKCAICNVEHDGYDPQGNKRRMDADHCHKTKRIRGLLCIRCNRGIGMLGDSVEIVSSALKYLKER